LMTACCATSDSIPSRPAGGGSQAILVAVHADTGRVER
jgi:hypothetical protein